MITSNLNQFNCFRRGIRKWFVSHRREFFWRAQSHDPFVVLVSEFMLQQTQTSRVETLLPIFLRQFPTIQALAEGPKSAVLIAWRGLGYNNRAVRLHDTAKEIQENHRGVIPSDYSELRKLKGIGDYTASAIMSFAFGKRVTVVDVNVARVLSRFFCAPTQSKISAEDRKVRRIAELLTPRNNSPQWHQSLMDFGATVCVARNPRCSVCPVSKHCASTGISHTDKQSKSEEPIHRGVPNRLWRGRIVNILRDTSSMSFVDLQKQLFSKPDEKDIEWLSLVLKAMKKDGIIDVENTGSRAVCLSQS